MVLRISYYRSAYSHIDYEDFSDSHHDPTHVDENYRRMAAAIGVKPEHMVCTHQTHTTNVRIVTKEDAGKGVTREKAGRSPVEWREYQIFSK